MLRAAQIDAADYRGHMSSGDTFDKEQGRKMEQAFSRWTLAATHKSGNLWSLRGMTIARFANGKIVEEWISMDNSALMAQLGGPQ